MTEHDKRSQVGTNDPLSLNQAAGVSNAALDYNKDYGPAIQTLAHYLFSAGYAADGSQIETKEGRAERLLQFLTEDSKLIEEQIHAPLRRYIEESRQSSSSLRGAVQHDDPVLAAFMSSAEALGLLLSLKGERTEVADAKLDASLMSISSAWRDLGSHVLNLDNKAQEKQTVDDMAEYDATLEQKQRESEKEADLADPRDEDDGQYADDDEQDEEDHEVEDVANWPGGTGGNWT